MLEFRLRENAALSYPDNAVVANARRSLVRFDVFEADLEAGELRKYERRVKLPQQSFRVLEALVERPMQLVSREELRQLLWPSDTFVEFDHGLNNAVNRLRETLGDSPQKPRFIETIPRRGYRFIAPIETPAADPIAQEPSPQVIATAGPAEALAPDRLSTSRRLFAFGAGAMAMVLLLVAIAWNRRTDPSPPSLVVLPFIAANAAEESPDAYLAFGMTDALISELSRSGALKVISQTSAMHYKGARKPLPVIARELGVTTVVEGSVVQEGGQVRLTVQLIDARSDAHLWTQTYTSDPSAALANQRARAREVAAIIRSRLVPDDRSPAPTLQSTTPAAYEAYLKGRYFLQQGGESTAARARQFFEEAIAADQGFAAAHAGLAHYFATTDALAPAQAMPRAELSARRALELDPSSAAGHAALAFVHYFWHWDWTAADRAFARALELDPNDALARRWHAIFLSAMGRHQTAAEEIALAVTLDPLSLSAFDAAGGVWSNARRFDKVVEQARHIHDLSPADPRGFMHLAIGNFYQEKYAEAIAAAGKAVEGSGRNPAYLCLLAVMQQRAGHTDAAQQTLAEIETLATKGYVPEVFLAVVDVWMGEHDAAVRHLNRAFDQRDGYLLVANVAPWVDPLREHAGFQDLLQRMRFPR